TEGGARNDRADDAVFAQTDERDAERGLAADGGRPEHLPVLAGIHGAVRAAVPMGGREDCRRLLCTTPEHIKLIRAEARSLQPGPHALNVTVEEPQAKAKALAKTPVADKSSWARSWRP